MNSRSGATRMVNGFLWPAYDAACAAVVFTSIPDLMRAVAQCEQRRTVIQAGGNCGVWARHLSDLFERVWTWEPDPLNYKCLTFNTRDRPNISCVNAALGERPGWASLTEPEPANCGALQLGNLSDAKTPEQMVLVDKMDEGRALFGHVDLIYLDLEGFELPAILGGSELIKACKPVIAVEDKGLSERFGIPKGEVIRFIESEFGYEICDQYARDFVLRPKADQGVSSV